MTERTGKGGLPQLILIGGPPGVGKTTAARSLFSRLEGSAWLDGDDVWRMNPFVADARTKPLVEANIAYVLRGYISARFRYVILSWALHRDDLIARILAPLKDLDSELSSFTLVCDEAGLRTRLIRDPDRPTNDLDRAAQLLARARKVRSWQIDTSELSPTAVAGLLLARLRSRESGH